MSSIFRYGTAAPTPRVLPVLRTGRPARLPVHIPVPVRLHAPAPVPVPVPEEQAAR